MDVNKIREIKKDLKMTTKRLSDLSGVPKGTLDKILTGKTSDPKLETLKSIAKALNCTVDDFIEDKSPLVVNENESKKDMYLSPEVSKMAQDIHDNPELRILFDASKKLTRDDVLFVVDIVKRMKNN